MKCQKLFITSLLVSGLSFAPLIVESPLACDHSSQSDTGESSSASNDSRGSNDSDTSNDAGRSNTSSATSERDGNGPSNFQLIDCSDPFWADFLPCFERMVKERENFVSQPE